MVAIAVKIIEVTCKTTPKGPGTGDALKKSCGLSRPLLSDRPLQVALRATGVHHRRVEGVVACDQRKMQVHDNLRQPLYKND